MSKQAGFTLIELVVVIVVLGILAAIAIPKYVDLAGVSRTAVVDGTKGALIAAAALYIGSTTGTVPNKAQIVAGMTTGNGVVVATASGSCNFTITPPGGSAVAYNMPTASGLCTGP